MDNDNLLNIGEARRPVGGFSIFHSALQQGSDLPPGSYLIRLREHRMARQTWRRPKISSLPADQAIHLRLE